MVYECIYSGGQKLTYTFPNSEMLKIKKELRGFIKNKVGLFASYPALNFTH